MPHRFRPTVLVLALLFGGVGVVQAQSPQSTPAAVTPVAPGAAPAAPASAPLPLDELRTFAEVFDRIKAAYVEPVSDKVLLENAIKGMLSNLDPHSAYLEPKDFAELQETTSGEFGGLGLEVGQENGFIKVVSPIDDTPAAKARLQPGDLIVKIDGQPTKGQAINEAVDKMRGKPGSPIVLTIVRGGGQPFDVKLARAVIKVNSVKSQLLESGYGLLRISQFQVNTGEETVKALAKLRQENKGKLKGLILDLRNNPGGVLQSAVEVADAFMTHGLIVYTKGRLPNSELRFSADAADPSEKVPLVVLINGGSASAAEIVAGALQDSKRGILMGTDSFGKGSVQTVLPLNNDRALKLTTALYYTPSGRSIQAQGITPDIAVAPAKVTPQSGGDEYFREADLAGHLGNGNGGADRPTGSKAPNQSPRPQDDDFQLSQALSLLKGLNVTHTP